MIPYPILVLLLAATTVAATPSAIDWNECRAEAKCIMESKCFGGFLARAADTLIAVPALDAYPECEAGLSIRPLTDDKWLLRMQILRPEFDPAKGIQLIYGDDLVTGCVLKGGSISLVPPKGSIDVVAELFPAGSSMLKSGHGFCSFLMLNPTNISTIDAQLRMESGFDPTGATVAPIKLAADTSSKIFSAYEIVKKLKCKPMTLKWNPESPYEDHTKHEVPDILSNTINCTAIKQSKLIVETKRGYDEVTDFVCDKSRKKYTYKKDGDDREFDDSESVFCAIPIDTSCKSLVGSGNNLPVFSKDPTTGKTSLKCLDKTKFVINDKFYFAGEAKCKNNPASPSLGAWFATTKKGDYVQIKTAECTDRFNCTRDLNIVLPEKDGKLEDGAHMVIVKPGLLKCADDNRLKVTQSSHNRQLTPSKITCNYTKGVYEMENPLGDTVARQGKLLDMEDSAKIYCEDDFKPSAATGANVNTIVGASVGGFLFLVLVIAAIVFIVLFYMARRRRAVQRTARRPPKNNSDGPPLSPGPTSGSSSVRSSKSARDNYSSALRDEQEQQLEFDPTTYKCFAERWINLPIIMKVIYIRYCIGARDRGKIRISKFMVLLQVMFSNETDPVVWKVLLPTLFFLEREFFHANQTNNHNVVEREKKIPGYCYERFRLFLLSRAEKVLAKYGETHHAGNTPQEGFVRGLAYLIQYKLNIMNNDARKALVDKLTDIFMKDRLEQEDASRMFIWGILRHEDTGSKRTPGIHERFGHGNDQFTMFDWLFEEMKELLKTNFVGDPKTKVGNKMQHILFAMGCSLDRQAMMKVWNLMKHDRRFTPNDYMYVIYARDWLWDGAWVSMCQDPSEHQLFCQRFGTKCVEYKQISEICISYIWPDKYSLDAQNGHCYEAYMLQYDRDTKVADLKSLYDFYDRFERSRRRYGNEMNDWLVFNDKRDIPGYTPTDRETLVAEAEARLKKREEEEDREEAKQRAERDRSKQRANGVARAPEDPKKAAAAAAPSPLPATATTQPAAAAAPVAAPGADAADAAANKPSSPSSSTPPSGSPAPAPSAPAPKA